STETKIYKPKYNITCCNLDNIEWNLICEKKICKKCNRSYFMGKNKQIICKYCAKKNPYIRLNENMQISEIYAIPKPYNDKHEWIPWNDQWIEENKLVLKYDYSCCCDDCVPYV